MTSVGWCICNRAQWPTLVNQSISQSIYMAPLVAIESEALVEFETIGEVTRRPGKLAGVVSLMCYIILLLNRYLIIIINY